MSSMLERSQLWQLTASRTREFLREPEAVFWTFFFPVLKINRGGNYGRIRCAIPD